MDLIIIIIRRRWRLLLAEALFAAALMVIAVCVAKPVFLTPLRAQPEAPLTSEDLLTSLNSRNLLGFAPTDAPYSNIMRRAASLLEMDILAADTEDDLNNILYDKAKGTPLKQPVIWVIWKPKDGNMWKFSIRSTERARSASSAREGHHNPHLRAGFLAVQVAVSQAIVEHASSAVPDFELSLVSMPISPLMQESHVRRAISGILLCITFALIPPVIETQALVVNETTNRFKRALKIRGVNFSTVYIAWLVYAYLTAFPVCLLVAFTLILIFRWIHLLFSLLIILAYVSVTVMFALIMAMFHYKVWIACLWSVLFMLLKLFLAEMVVHHQYDVKHVALTFVLQLILPPLGLVHALNEFAMLQTGRGSVYANKPSVLYTVLSWTFMNCLYFLFLMIMQRTMRHRAIGGQVSWKSIIFKKVEDPKQLRPIKTPTGLERNKLQEVDELVAKAISFRNVNKTIMNVPVLNDITLDIYRGEFTMLYCERIQNSMLITIEDLLTGLTYPDEGTITILGQTLKSDTNLMVMPQMMGYCHNYEFLIGDLTVEEHLTLFIDISLWNEPKQYTSEFQLIRMRYILAECDLETLRHVYVRNLGSYFRAQLCWAIALLMEPRIIFISNFTNKPTYIRVIQDKIMRYKKYITIVMLCYTSIRLECADRVFVFDNRVLVFGGSPAYMFFKYGREYRVRIAFRTGTSGDSENTALLLERASYAGATVRAHLGSMLILRLPANPTNEVTALVKDLTDNAAKYDIVSMSISLPDTEEVTRRAINESRMATRESSPITHHTSKEAMKRIAEGRMWERKQTSGLNATQLRIIAWKFTSFFLYHKSYFIGMLIAAFVTGLLIGISLSSILAHIGVDKKALKLIHGEILTVEALEQRVNLVLRSDNSSVSRSVVNAYVLSQTKATDKEVKDMTYTALSHTESLTEYLVTRAIDSPQHYVYMFAYGMDVSSDPTGKLTVQALYSPLHHDQGAAARSVGRVYTSLLRHYTKTLDASIEVTDDPLALDLSPWIGYAEQPPLFIQFMLVLTISHITLIPSMEHGLVRHVQSQAMNFSPARYWLSLFFCDFMLYLIMVIVMTFVAFTVVHFSVELVHFTFIDLLVVPAALIVYGLGCIPQAYLFSIGPRPALNSMTFVIVNVVLGETTVIAKLFYGNALYYALYFMRLSPQFNMAYAYVKIKTIFFYNSECVLFETKNLCSSSKILHKCCEKCGILQECFSRRNYFTMHPGIMVEMCAMLGTTVLFATLLLIWEYKFVQRLWANIIAKLTYSERLEDITESIGYKREKTEVTDKLAEIESKRREKVDTFGEYLLLNNVSKKEMGLFLLSNIYFGIGKGEVLALSGLKRSGRVNLCEILGGYQAPASGDLWCMSKWRVMTDPYRYSRNIALSCERNPLPLWMTVHEALKLVAVLRGVPTKYVKAELKNYIEALELTDQANVRIQDLLSNERNRVHFAAAVVGAPPVLVLDECTAHQKYSVRRAMYFILNTLKRRGHAIYVSASNVESLLPITNRLAILVDGYIYDIDHVDMLVERYSKKGYTVVVHLKDDVNVTKMFGKHFRNFSVNDTTEVLVNVQVYDSNLTWANIFEAMEQLKERNHQVYSYIVSAIPIDYIYNSILSNEQGLKESRDLTSFVWLRKMFTPKILKKPSTKVVEKLIPFEKKYDITTLKELPWSVIFNR